MTTPFITIIEGAGVIFAGLSGTLEARRKGMDLVGVTAVALITAFGGGTLRDLLLDRRPFYWAGHPYYVAAIFVLSIGYLYGPGYFRRTAHTAGTATAAGVFDAVALGLFAVVSTYYALAQGQAPFIATLFGVIGSCFGGVLRDIVCNEVPVMFVPGGLYATAAFAGSWIAILLGMAGIPERNAGLAGGLATAVLRIAAIRYNLGLPAVRQTAEARIPDPPER
jgi:uncharacterized membrane protein YeiH